MPSSLPILSGDLTSVVHTMGSQTTRWIEISYISRYQWLINVNCRSYIMNCIPVTLMPSQRKLVLVFWKVPALDLQLQSSLHYYYKYIIVMNPSKLTTFSWRSLKPCLVYAFSTFSTLTPRHPVTTPAAGFYLFLFPLASWCKQSMGRLKSLL